MITCLTLAIGMHIGTNHAMTAGHKFHDFNPGVYARCDQNVVGVYSNSIGGTSAYVARLFPIAPNIEVSVGAVSGYGSRLSPLVALQFKRGPHRIAFIPTTPLAQGGMHVTTEF